MLVIRVHAERAFIIRVLAEKTSLPAKGAVRLDGWLIDARLLGVGTPPTGGAAYSPP